MKLSLALIPAFLVPALLSSPFAGAEPTSSDTELERALSSFDVPGIAMATLAACELVEITVAGEADIEAGRAVAANTAFEAASLSKPVFAWLVVKLSDEGLIDLDRPIAEDFAYARIEDAGNYAKLTPRMILSHRTGLPNWVGDTDNPGRGDIVPFNSPAGKAYSYSGEAYELLRAYVEDQIGMSLETLFRTYLGDVMPRSTFSPPLPEEVETSRGYRAASQPKSGRALDVGGGGAAGGLVTTIEDYAGFISHVCKGNGLSLEAQAAMLEPQSPVPAGQFPAPTSWSLGWNIMQLGPETFVMHDGNNGEYRTMTAFLPQTGEGYVFLTNGTNGGDLILSLIEAMQ